MSKEKKQKYEYLVTIQFDSTTKQYTFGSHKPYDPSTQVVVETVRGKEIGTVVKESIPFDAKKTKGEIKPVLRAASKKDLEDKKANEEDVKEAMKVCRQCIENLGLDMHLINGEYTLDRAKVIFTYVADERVDFRQLLKDLAGRLHCRIELRQIGSRNKAKMVGGLGNCGMETCCSRFMSDFDTVSINMAKNQLLALNISKLSGQCGKLMCCLRFENEEYTRLRDGLPKINSQIEFENTRYKITGMNVIQKQAKLENKEEVRFVPFEQLWPDKDFSDD
ncbi:MAG: stage 0 sporulation protein [Erysipelotrichaceae bacterium]|nr:stage 0 sporulation protein [Erysipelotrichaceae bacterium]